MARSKAAKGPAFPAWFYGPDGEGIICHSAEDVPEGWQRKRGTAEPVLIVQPTAVLNRDELLAELDKRGITVDPRWGSAHLKRIIDGDVSPTR